MDSIKYLGIIFCTLLFGCRTYITESEKPFINKNDSAIYRSLLDSNGLNNVDIYGHCSTDANGNIISIYLNGLEIGSFGFTHDSEGLLFLTSVDMQSNHLTAFPKGLGILPNLKRILVDNNKLSTFTSELLKLDELEVLSISSNLFDSVPAAIDSLKSLNYLNVNRNNLVTLPDEIVAMKSFYDSTKYTNVYVYHNKICNPSFQMEQFLNRFNSNWMEYQSCP